MAPGLGLGAYFTYSVVLNSHHTWQVALGAVFVSGILFFILSILPIRQYMINSIPKSLKVAIAAGIGLFLGIIGFKNAGIITSHSITLLTLGDLHQPQALLSILGFFIIIGLDALGIIGATIISIFVTATIGIFLGYGKFGGIFSMPPSLAPTLLQMDIQGALRLGLVSIVFAFLFVDLFDNTGTLIGIAYRAGFMDKHGKLPRIHRALIADSSAAFVGAALGTSTTTSFVESAVGVKAGARTGLMSVTVAIFFILALFLSPLAMSIPLYATAPALIYVACLMTRAFTEINWDDITEYVPAVITAISMPLTFSIAEGISFGFISYTAIKIVSGRFKDLNIALIILSSAFILRYICN
jgi:adenine/guanine/hypoxanthine permease